jgi:hypothetical protein
MYLKTHSQHKEINPNYSTKSVSPQQNPGAFAIAHFPFRHIPYILEKREGRAVKKKRIRLTLAEWRMVIYALNSLRTSLINEGKYTDVVDETLIKVINAPTKRIRVS